MLFPKLRRSSKTQQPAAAANLTSAGASPVDDNGKQGAAVLTRETSQDYELFLENAKREAELKEQEMLRLAKEAQRRRKEFDMDPWSKRW